MSARAPQAREHPDTMPANGASPAEQYLKRRERLLISAIRLLDEAGLSGLTTRELAKREGISEPAVYRHFDGKTEVLLAILDRFAEFDGIMANTVRENGMDPLVAIYHVSEAYAAYYAGYPEISNVMFSLDFWKYDPVLEQRMQAIFASRHELYRMLVEEAVRTGALSATTDVTALTDLVSGLVGLAVQQWKMSGQAYDLRERVLHMMALVLPETDCREVRS